MPHATANGVGLYYEWHGHDSAPVLVLNNGILMNAATSWAFQTAALSRRYRLLQYDCRGQGQSEHPAASYSMALHAHDLAALLEALGVARAHILGISYGGEVAQAFALLYPKLTRSLILADTVSEVGPALRIVADGWQRLAMAGDAAGFFEATVPWNFSPAFIAAHPQLIAEARQRYTQLDLPAVARLCASFLEVDFTAQLGQITAPACVLVGEADRLKGRDYAELLHHGLKDSELHVLPGAGHASCWERPAEFNSVALGFLAKQDQG
jgi:3-oxoadipate enol-lactonase